MMDVLREARENAGISQVALSRKMKRTENYINLVENGQRLPNHCEFIEIVQAFDGDAGELTTQIVKRSAKKRK